MAMSNPDLEEFVKAFEGLGYSLVPDVPRYHARDRFYRHVRSTSDVEYFAALDFKPKFQTFGLRVGASNPQAMLVLKDALPALTRYLHPATARLRLSEFPCWMLFDAGRALSWDLLAIPAPIDRSGWSTQIEQLEKFLERTFWPIKTVENILDLLFRNDRPFEWHANGSILRAAEIITLGRLSGIRPAVTRERLMPFEKAVLRQMEGASDFNAFLDELFRILVISN